MAMYEKDKVMRCTVRFNAEQTDFLTSHSEIMGMSVSEFLRMTVNAMMFAEKNSIEVKPKEDKRRENEQAHIDNRL